MKKFERIKKIIVETTVEELVNEYIDIVTEINNDITVNEKLVKKHVEFGIDPSSFYDISCVDFRKTIKENVEEYFEQQRKSNDHDWWLDWNTPEELYQMGIENNWIKEDAE